MNIKFGFSFKISETEIPLAFTNVYLYFIYSKCNNENINKKIIKKKFSHKKRNPENDLITSFINSPSS